MQFSGFTMQYLQLVMASKIISAATRRSENSVQISG
jgi:hypothetical protein